MRTVYAIAPWEYPGADFDPNPHTFARRVFAGKERELWLKVRDGVIYFGEVEHARTFAVTRLFDDAIAADAEQLVALWKGEVERENYGASIVIRRKFPRSFAVGSFCVILREDGSGWICEHFDGAWTEFESSLPETLRLWGVKPFGKIGASVVQQMQSHFLGRTVDPVYFQTVAPHWSNGTEEEVAAMMRWAAQLWLSPEMIAHYNGHLRWYYRSGSAFFEPHAGDVFTSYPWSHNFRLIQKIFDRHYVFIGVEWNRVSDDTALQQAMSAKARKDWRTGIEKWSKHWRGNWVGRQHEITFTAPPPSVPSHHDKLEAALVLRDFLQDKLPAPQIEAMLQDALKN